MLGGAECSAVAVAEEEEEEGWAGSESLLELAEWMRPWPCHPS